MSSVPCSLHPSYVLPCSLSGISARIFVFWGGWIRGEPLKIRSLLLRSLPAASSVRCFWYSRARWPPRRLRTIFTFPPSAALLDPGSAVAKRNRIDARFEERDPPPLRRDPRKQAHESCASWQPRLTSIQLLYFVSFNQSISVHFLVCSRRIGFLLGVQCTDGGEVLPACLCPALSRGHEY